MAQITKPMLQKFRIDFEKKMSRLEKKYGLEIKLGRIGYDADGNSFKASFEATNTDENPEGMTGTQAKFASMAPLYGLKAEDFGKVIILQGRRFIITGLNPRARKSPVQMKEVDGAQRNFKAPVNTILNALKK